MTMQGGQAPFTYTWTVDGKVVDTTGSANPWTVLALNWSMTGNHTLDITVTDTQGVSSTFTITIAVEVDQVGPVTLTVTHMALDAGMWNNATLSWSGGWAPYTFHYLIVTPTTTEWLNTTSARVDMQWNGTGTVAMSALVVDAYGHSAWQNISFTVNPDMTLPCSPTYTGNPVPASNLTFTLGCLSGGTAPYTYHWIVGSVIITTTTGTVGLGFTSDGIYNVSVNVTDAAGMVVTSKKVTVIVDQLGSLTVQPTAKTVDVGMKDNLTLSFTGGLAPFTFHYYISTPTRNWWVNDTSPTLELDASTVEPWTVSATVLDAYGRSATQNVTLTVNPDPAAPCAPTYAGVPMPGNALAFTLGCLSGGTGAYAYQWSLGGVTKVTTNGTVTYSFMTAGFYNVSVSVTDALGMVTDSRILQMGTELPLISGVSYHLLSSKTGKESVEVTLNITLAATDPDGQVTDYRWGTAPSLAGALWEPISQRVLTFNVSTANATFDLYFQVEDSSGRTSTVYQLPLNTSSLLSRSNGGGPSSSADQVIEYTVLVALVVAVIVIGLIFLARRKKPTTASGDPDHAPQDDIYREVKSRTDGKWVEENTLVQETSAATGKDHAIVRAKLQIFCESGWVEPQGHNGSQSYRWVGSTAAAEEDGRSRAAKVDEIIDEAFRDPENAGGVTGADLKARGEASGLRPVPDEMEWLSHMGDRGGKVTMVGGEDFDTTVWRLKLATDQGFGTSMGDVTVDEDSLLARLNANEDLGDKLPEEGRHGGSTGGVQAASPPEWAEDGEGGHLT